MTSFFNFDAPDYSWPDLTVSFGSIPGNLPSKHYEATCTKECTNTFKSNITVFSSLLHQHGKLLFDNGVEEML